MLPPGAAMDPQLLAGIYGAQQGVGGQSDLYPNGLGDFAQPNQRRQDENRQSMADSQGFYSQHNSSGAIANYLLQQSNNADLFPSAGNYNFHARRDSIDQVSDSSGTQSGCNSAASSSVHLPLADLTSHLGQNSDQPRAIPFDLDSYSGYNDNSQPLPHSRDGRFSSAFGHLSLDDAAALAGLTSDNNAPFFSGAAMKLPPQDSTPRPFRDEDMAKHLARDRDSEMRELRDFWKQYLRTPLSGPPLGTTPKAENGGQFGARPSPKRGLSRVASLPSVKTPSDEKGPVYLSRVDDDPTRSRPFHNIEDLKSYEQAVMARQAPTTLNLAPRKTRPVTATASPVISQTRGLEPGRSPSLPHSLADTPRRGLLSMQPPDGPLVHDDSAVQSRPSFKRLPSQTLEPANSKRTHFRWDDAVEDTDSDADVDGGNNDPYRMPFSQALFDRYRRQSAPTSARPTPA